MSSNRSAFTAAQDTIEKFKIYMKCIEVCLRSFKDAGCNLPSMKLLYEYTGKDMNSCLVLHISFYLWHQKKNPLPLFSATLTVTVQVDRFGLKFLSK